MPTLLYTDIVGSTEMVESLGEAESHRLLVAQRHLVEACVAEAHGVVAQDLGDGLQLVFDDPAAAVRCAVAVQQGLFEQARRDPGRTVRLRIGIHTGEVVRDGDRYMGRAAIVAQRVMSAAGAGEILVSAATERLARGIAPARTVSRGRFRLKGLAQPVLLFEVIWRAEDVGSEREPGAVALLRRAGARETAFVGRDAELSGLEQDLAEASDGRGRIVLIQGPAGIGKTRLAGEFLAAVADRALVAATGHFAEGRALPFAAFAECVSALLRRPDAPAVPKELVRGLAPLAALVPELAAWVPAARPRSAREPREVRRRLVETFSQLWLTWSREQTLVLLLDDLQWADAHSLDLLALLAHRLGTETARLLVVGTLRDAASEPSEPLRASLADLRREGAYELALGGLRAAESELVCRNAAGLGSELRARICRRSGGNPLFIGELSRALAAEPAGGESHLPARVQDVIERRLARLSPACLEALRTAAVLGSGFELRVLAHALGAEAPRVVEAVDEAWRARLLTERESRHELRYAFEHALVAECLLAQQSAARRQQTHARVADAILVCTPPGAEPPASTLAFHLLRAGASADPARVAEFAARAGEEASALFAFSEAAELFAAAIEASGRAGAPDPVRDARLRARLSWALGRIGQVGRAREEADAAIDALAAAGDARAVAEVRLATGQLLGLHAMHREALPYLEAVIDATAASPDVLHGEAMARYAIALDGTGEPQPMRSIARRVRTLARRLSSEELEERAHHVERNWYVNHTSDFARALRLTEDLSRSAESRRDPWYGSMYCNEVAFLLFLRGRVREAAAMAGTALARADSTGTAAEILNARALRAIACCFRGEWEQLDAEWAHAVPHLGRVPGALRVGLLLWARRQADAWLARPDVRAPSPARIYREMGPAGLAVAASTAWLAVQRGAPGSADLLGAARAALRPDGTGLLWLIAAQGVAAGLAELGRGAEAIELAEALRPYAGTLYLGSTSLELARLARQQGDPERGLGHVRAAIRQARREELRPLLALGLLEEAKLLEAANCGGPRAHAAAKRGIALAEELGMRGVLQRAT